MGTCYSNTEEKRIRKSNTNKSRKSNGCLGSFCNDSEGLEAQNRQQAENRPIINIKSSFKIYHKADKLNNELDEVIKKYSDKLEIKKINYIQLYNIFMNYIFDFTQSNLVLCDSREESKEKKQLFLKKFPQINYSLKQIESLNDERLNKLCNFLRNKYIIFILKDDSSIDILEKYMIFFIANNFDGKFRFKGLYILSEYISEYDDKKASNSYLENLYHFIDEDILYDYYPKILINLSDIKSSNLNYISPNSNNAYIFINKYPHNANSQHNKNDNNKILNKFDINYLCNKNTEENDTFLNFVSKFHINYILNFILFNDNKKNQKNIKYVTHSEAKRNKTSIEEKKSFIKQKNISIVKDMEFGEYYKIIQGEFISIIEEFKNQVIQNNCILIQFDDNIDNIFKLKLLYIIIFRITGLEFNDIFEYLKSNFYDIENESNFLSKKEEIINFLV